MSEPLAVLNVPRHEEEEEDDEEELSLTQPISVLSAAGLSSDSNVAPQTVSLLEMGRIRIWNRFFCVAYIALAIATVICVGIDISPSPVVEVMIPLYDQNSAITVPTPHRVGFVHVFWLMPVFSFVAAIQHFIVWQRLTDIVIAQQLREGTHLLQWIEYSLSNSIVVMMVALLIGVTDLFTIMGFWGLTAGSAMTWFAVEEISNRVRKEIVFVVGFVLQAVVVISLAALMFSGVEHLTQSTIGAFAILFVFQELCAALTYGHQFDGSRQVNAAMRTSLGSVLNRPQNGTVQQLHALASQASNVFDVKVRRDANFSIFYMFLAFTCRLVLVLALTIGDR